MHAEARGTCAQVQRQFLKDSLTMKGDAINLSQVGEQSSAQHTKQGPKLESHPEHASRLHQHFEVVASPRHIRPCYSPCSAPLNQYAKLESDYYAVQVRDAHCTLSIDQILRSNSC